MWRPPRRPQSPLAPRPSPTTAATRVRAEVSVVGRRSETLEGGGCRLEEIEESGSGWRCCGGSRGAEVGGAGSGWKKACGGGESEGREVGRTTCAAAAVAHRGGGRRSASTTGEAASSGKRRRGSRRRSASRLEGYSTPAKKIRISASAMDPWLEHLTQNLSPMYPTAGTSVHPPMVPHPGGQPRPVHYLGQPFGVAGGSQHHQGQGYGVHGSNNLVDVHATSLPGGCKQVQGQPGQGVGVGQGPGVMGGSNTVDCQDGQYFIKATCVQQPREQDGLRQMPTSTCRMNRLKQANFGTKEDVNLCPTWLAVSCDPVTNTGQKKGAFWARVIDAYNGQRENFPERSLKSLEKRWDAMKNECSRFAGYMAAVLRENASGMLDADKTSEAVTRFGATEQRNFNFLHCWNILKDEPKWMDMRQKAAEEIIDIAVDGTPPVPNTVNIEGDQSSPGSSSSKRPLGRDASKESRKKTTSSLGSAASSEYVSKMHDLHLERARRYNEKSEEKNTQLSLLLSMEQHKLQKLEEKCALQAQRKALEEKQLALAAKHKVKQSKHRAMQLAVDRERLAIEKARSERETRQEEERILGMNLDDCAPPLREYYAALQASILSKVRRPINMLWVWSCRSPDHVVFTDNRAQF